MAEPTIETLYAEDRDISRHFIPDQKNAQD